MDAQIVDFYENCAEAGRLERRLGIIEFYRTKEILGQYLQQGSVIYFDMLREEITTGNHNRPEEYCRLVAQAYFHTAEGMEQEVEEAGFRVLATHAGEGCIWFTPNLNENWESPEIREKLLEILHLTEKDKELMGMSPHFLTMAVKE